MILHDSRKQNAFKLLIRSCRDVGSSWYSSEVGKYFEFLGEDTRGYITRNKSGELAYVKRDDGELIKI